MSTSTLSVKQDDAALIHLKQAHLWGWLFSVIGIGVFCVPFFKPDAEGDVWVAHAVGALFALVGLLVALYRLEIKLNLHERRYHVIKGFVPRPKQFSGQLDNTVQLNFDKQWRSSGSENKSKQLHWQTGLHIPNVAQAITLHETRDEQQARQYFEKRAKQLRVSTLDKTGASPVEKNWDELDESVQQRMAETPIARVNEHQPPAGLKHEMIASGVGYSSERPGFNSGSLIGILFGLPFFVFGIVALFVGLGLHKTFDWDIQVSGSLAASAIMGSIFGLIGGAVIKFSIDHAFTHYRFAFTRENFTLTTLVYNRQAKEQRLAASSIEDFGVRDSTSSRSNSSIRVNGVQVFSAKQGKKVELFARSDEALVKVNSLNLAQAEFLNAVFYQRQA